MQTEKVLQRIIEKIQASQDGKTRKQSKTFWKELGIMRRTDQMVQTLKNEMEKQGIIFELSKGELGEEDENEWIYFKKINIPVPDENWFNEMNLKTFESETEVSVFFIAPLFKKLGYSEEDFYFEYSIKFPIKFEREFRGKRPDLVLFHGSDRTHENALIVVEAKKPIADQEKNEDNIARAAEEIKYYSMQFPNIHRSIATNGDDIVIFRPSADHAPDLVLRLHRSELKAKWHNLYLAIAKPMLLQEKQ